jgi:hypothetical protein
MAFSIKFTEGVCPGKKLQTLKRSAEEIYDARTSLSDDSALTCTIQYHMRFSNTWRYLRLQIFLSREGKIVYLYLKNKVVLIIRALSFSSSSCDLCFCAYKSAEHVKYVTKFVEIVCSKNNSK